MAFFHYAVFFILALGILIAFHEYGHYWVARKCDVKILRFSIGFGKPIYKRIYGKDNTEFVIGGLPLGGYVKMLDEREGIVPFAERDRAFNNKPVGQRIAIVAAGPIFNFIFAIFALAAMYMVGVEGMKPIIGEVKLNSIAGKADLRTNDEIISINGETTPSLRSVIEVLAQEVVSGSEIELVVKNGTASSERKVYFDLSAVKIDDIREADILEVIGFQPIIIKHKPILGQIIQGEPAELAGLQTGDKILSVNKLKIDSWREFVTQIQENPSKNLTLAYKREGQTYTVNISPKAQYDERLGKTVGKIGAGLILDEEYLNSFYTVEYYSPLSAFGKAATKTWDMSVMTLEFLGKMITGQASVKNLSGPITIAEYAGKSASIGLTAFLSFLAMVSISLGVLNLLPIPLLDGGHLLYYLIECVIGKEVPESVQVTGQQVGLTILLGLMSVAFYNDITRLLG